MLAAIAFWIVGRWLIGRVVGLMQAAMNRNHVDPTLTQYLGSIVAIALSLPGAQLQHREKDRALCASCTRERARSRGAAGARVTIGSN